MVCERHENGTIIFIRFKILSIEADCFCLENKRIVLFTNLSLCCYALSKV